MEKKYLRFGYVVELRSGWKCLIHPHASKCGCDDVGSYLENKFTNPTEKEIFFRRLTDGENMISLDKFDEDFKTKNKHNSRFDIMKIYEDYTCQKLLWSREGVNTKKKTKRIFSLEKYKKDTEFSDKLIGFLGWPQECEGKEVIDGMCFLDKRPMPYLIDDNWTIVIEE